MIVNFYKKPVRGFNTNVTLVSSKNIDIIPQKGTFVEYHGQHFQVERIHFDLANCVYNVYMVRV